MTSPRAIVSLVACAACSACAPLDLGSNLLWSTDHESGTLNDWSSAPGGGVFEDSVNSPVQVVAGPAHSGRFSLELSDLGTSDTDGPGVHRDLETAPDAYYSAWFYLPQAYVTRSKWTIEQFLNQASTNPVVYGHDFELALRALPGGQLILFVFSHDPAYLQPPLSDPPALVPIGEWFQVEVFFRARSDESGELLVWLDDRLVYDIEDRRTLGPGDLVWTLSSVAEDVTPTPTLYVDDAAISLSRVTTHGKLRE
ncbi:MAG TPA: heparin lyase I family protein [Polyangiaceae bacterium]|jgi:hypothetical protein|nr:heparin lyase I family protein [Polyangiaceae bacterium]